MKINETKVCLDFHIYAILDFDLLIGYPFEKLFKEKLSHGCLDENLGTTASATHIPSLENPKAKQQPKHNTFEEVKFISPFVSPKLACETECIPSPLLKPKSCRPSYPSIILENKNFRALDMPKAPTLETQENDFTVKHEGFSFKTPHFSCSFLEFPESVVLSTTCINEEYNLPSLLISKLFRRMVVDVFVYHKYCRSCGCTVVLTLQLEHYVKCLVVKLGTTPPLIAAR
jgi:hypothetical protein